MYFTRTGNLIYINKYIPFVNNVIASGLIQIIMCDLYVSIQIQKTSITIINRENNIALHLKLKGNVLNLLFMQ